jgi:hypothetical protein
VTGVEADRPLRWTVMATQVPAGGSLGGIVRYTTELITALAARSDVEDERGTGNAH